MKRLLPAAATVLFAVALFGSARPAHAQATGAAGTSGVGTLAAADFFIAVQKDKGVNLGVYDLPRFFNKAVCDCDQEVFGAHVADVHRLRQEAARAGRQDRAVGRIELRQRDDPARSVHAPARRQSGAVYLHGDWPMDRQHDGEPDQHESDSGRVGGRRDERVGDRGKLQRRALPADDLGAGRLQLERHLRRDAIAHPGRPDRSRAAARAPDRAQCRAAWQRGGHDFVDTRRLRHDHGSGRLPGPVPARQPARAGVQQWNLRGVRQDLRDHARRRARGSRSGVRLLPSALALDVVVPGQILQNGIVYGTTVVAVDASGNASKPDVREAIPTKTMSFYDFYRNGNETNGAPVDGDTRRGGGRVLCCRRRSARTRGQGRAATCRRRARERRGHGARAAGAQAEAPLRRLALSTLGLALAVLAPARAGAVDILTDPPEESPRHRFRSPQNFALEAFEFGPYRPDIDSEFEGRSTPARTPYATYYGNARRLLTQLEVDWQIFRRFGSIGVGVGVGYFSVAGTAPLDSGLPSGDRSTLTVVPFSVSGVYRFDYLLETRDIPLVPYGKLAASTWRFSACTTGRSIARCSPTRGSARRTW